MGSLGRNGARGGGREGCGRVTVVTVLNRRKVGTIKIRVAAGAGYLRRQPIRAKARIEMIQAKAWIEMIRASR